MYELLLAPAGEGGGGEEAARRGSIESSLYGSWFNCKDAVEIWSILLLGHSPPFLSLVLPKVRDSPFEPLPPLVAGLSRAGSSPVPAFRSPPG